METKTCVRCGKPVTSTGSKICNDCEVASILGYENARLQGKTHDEAIRIMWPEDEDN